MQDLSQKYDGVRLGLRANALALVGQQTGDLSVVAEAWRMYSNVLQTLARSLSRITVQKETTDDELLMTSALLAAFEVQIFLIHYPPPLSHGR